MLTQRFLKWKRPYSLYSKIIVFKYCTGMVRYGRVRYGRKRYGQNMRNKEIIDLIGQNSPFRYKLTFFVKIRTLDKNNQIKAKLVLEARISTFKNWFLRSE